MMTLHKNSTKQDTLSTQSDKPNFGRVQIGDIKSVSSAPNMFNLVERQRVIDERTICYCSNFDLNVADWKNEFDNL